MREIIWLASYPKSGNTWVRLMLSAYHRGYLDINDISSTTSDANFYHYQLVSPLPVNDMPTHDLMLIRNAALLHMQYQHRYRPVITKTHNANVNFKTVPIIPPEFTKAAIHIVRDPRDVVISFADHMGLSIDETIDKMAEDNYFLGHKKRAPTYLGTWNNHVKSWSGENPFNVINYRYEDIKLAPEAALKQMIELIGLDVDEDRIKKTVEMTEFSKLKSEEKNKGFNEKSEHSKKFFNRGTSGHWKEILTKKQVNRIELDHGEMMERFNYLCE